MANVTVRLTVGNFSVEVSGPEAYVNAKIDSLVSQYLTATRSPGVEGQKQAPSLRAGDKKLAPAEFLSKLGHHNQRDRALALGYYLEKFEGFGSFTTGELKGLESKTKYPFTNVSDTVLKLVSRGLMMNAGEKDGQRAYALTASGEEYVDAMKEEKSTQK